MSYKIEGVFFRKHVWSRETKPTNKVLIMKINCVPVKVLFIDFSSAPQDGDNRISNNNNNIDNI